MSAIETFLEARKTNLSLEALAVREYIRNNPGTMNRNIANALGLHERSCYEIVNKLVQLEEVQKTKETSPRYHFTFSAV